MSEPRTPVVYLDVCCLNRPFDDQSRERIRIESEAITALLERGRRGLLEMVTSQVVDFETARVPDTIRRAEVRALLGLAVRSIEVTDGVQARGAELVGLGFDPLDALHLACAEVGGVTVFLTTDDALLRRAKKHAMMLSVVVENPTTWFLQVLDRGDSRADPDAH